MRQALDSALLHEVERIITDTVNDIKYKMEEKLMQAVAGVMARTSVSVEEDFATQGITVRFILEDRRAEGETKP